MCSVKRVRTHAQSGHPFRVSEIFPSTYHQGSVQYVQKGPTHGTKIITRHAF